ncbi:hypothetical protein BDP27DRAFT_610552 [Rhodocollybia butyracea]|uniref:Uncharacterized protein n=1 Tax=Rhodocollybia butyracea TaxID=206335 RepID=A0A9P5Q8F3_9AGAR|nr:hypothetical protein BDP27DRAFT_610552 [Rhodocollybia butyracea]
MPNTPSSSQLKSDSAIPRSVPKSNKKNRDQRSFDVLINFVPSSVIDEGDEALLNSVSFVSATSRSFLSGIGVTSDRRGRSMSRGTRGRSSSLTRIKDWVSRSRSRSRIRDISITRLNGASKPTWNFSTVVGSGGKKRVPKSPAVVSIRNNAAKGEMSATAEDDCDDAGDSSAIRNQTYVQRKRERATSLVSENIQRTRALMQIRSTVNQVPKESRNKRAEKKVLSSWSRSQLDQANRTNEDDDVFIRGKGTPSPRKPTHPSTEEPRAYIIHVLPLSPPAVLHASFGPSRHTTIVSHASGSGSGSGLSSAETDIPLLGASHNISGKDIKQNDIVHSVPDALKPESILSSKVTALNKHMRGASLDSTNQPVFSPTNSLLSLSALHSSLSRNEIKEQPSVEGKIRKEASDSSHSTEGTQSLLSSHDHVSSRYDETRSRQLPHFAKRRFSPQPSKRPWKLLPDILSMPKLGPCLLRP